MKIPAAIIALAILGLSACGQKGPLFLPGDPSQIRPQPPTADEATDEEEEDDAAGASGPGVNR